MIFVGIILTGTLMGALLLCAFGIGYKFGQSHVENDGVTVTDSNKDFIEEMQKWKNFDGRR